MLGTQQRQNVGADEQPASSHSGRGTQVSTNSQTSHTDPNLDFMTSNVGDDVSQQPSETVPSRPIRVPGTYPPEWLPDQEANSCMACEDLFTLIRRRHHCRSCGKIFCSDCCNQRAKLLYMDNKEARVCNNCYRLIENTLAAGNSQTSDMISTNVVSRRDLNDQTPSTSGSQVVATISSTAAKVHGVLKNIRGGTNPNQACNTSTSSSPDAHQNKQVMFADGIRPGTDLSEPHPASSSSSEVTPALPCSILTRQSRESDNQTNSTTCTKKNRSRGSKSLKTITVCDEIGYLPPILMSKKSPILCATEDGSASSNPLANLIMSQFKSSKKSIQASMESRSSPLNGVVKFEEIAGLVDSNNIVTFLLIREFFLKVKIVTKTCCIDKQHSDLDSSENSAGDCGQPLSVELSEPDKYWCFLSTGLDRFGQSEVLMVIDKDKNDSCIPRDIFKIYLTLHELALRRQSLENLGNLLFQDGLFGSRDTAGLLFVAPVADTCLKNLIQPESKTSFLVALVLQRWEVPWSKVFPVRLLMGLGHKYGVYPFPIVSFRTREPIYYEVGHTIISILGDFRNFRYSIIHVDGLKVMLNKYTKKVHVRLNQSNYQQFNKVLDESNNEHVLAWSSSPFQEADGHLVSVQNDDGQYETVEFYKKTNDRNVSFKKLESGLVLGASFIIFSGALKVNQSGQPAKISIVEDGLLIQIQSCTMTALKNAIHFMHHFDIDCENTQEALNRVEIEWEQDGEDGA